MKLEFVKEHPILSATITLSTLLVAVATLYFQYKTTSHDLGGILQATFHTKSLNNKDSRSIVVCVDDMDMLNQSIYITPTFDNPDQYSLRDFSLTYEVVAEGVELHPSDFVSLYHSSGSQSLYQYKNSILQAHMDTKNPFDGFRLKNDVARCAIVSKVTYDGAVCMFEYRSDIWFLYLPKSNNVSFDYWKLNCKQKIFKYVDEKEFDVYYITKDNKTEYQFDYALGVATSSNKPLIENKEEERHPQNTKSAKVIIPEYSKEKEIAGEHLKIDDYVIERNDTSKITFFFNRPAEKDCDLILEYSYKHKGSLFPLFDTRHSIIHVNQGLTGAVVNEPDNPKKIRKIILYHQVNPNDYFSVAQNFDGYLKLRLIGKGDAILLAKYDAGGYFVKEVDNKYSRKFDKDVTIESFFHPSVVSYYFYGHTFIYIALLLIVLIVALILGDSDIEGIRIAGVILYAAFLIICCGTLVFCLLRFYGRL